MSAIHRAHRVGNRTRNPRTIVAKMARYSDRDQALRNAPKGLKGTKIRISEDLCAASLLKRSDQWSKYIDAKKNNKIAYFRHTKLIIRDRPPQSDSATGGTGAGASSRDDATSPRRRDDAAEAQQRPPAASRSPPSSPARGQAGGRGVNTRSTRGRGGQ